VATVLDGSDPGLFRNRFGLTGADPLMQPAAPRGQAAARTIVQSGGVPSTDGRDLLPGHWSRVFHPGSEACALLVLGVLVLLIHANAHVRLAGAAGVGR
jgi:hypothetical protein